MTQWTHHPATGLELSKIYADGTNEVRTYDAFNRLATITDARGVVKTHTYDVARGLLLSESYSDDTNNRTYVYNFLAMPVQISDDAGVRNLMYNSFNELETDSLVADSVTHLVTELRDNYGRSVGYSYAKNGSVQQTVSTGYGSDGRIATAGFVHGGAMKQFGYAYLNGTNLLQTLTMPNNMSLTQDFEEKRDLLTQMAYKRGNTLVSQRVYTYDALGRPLTRQTSRNGQTTNDSFVHTYRSELASAQVNGQTYAYDYDNIGNRRLAIDASDYAFYDANELNQYSSIRKNEDPAFVPTFDAAGNQTLVRTSTGTWSVSYNAENRPVIFQKTTDSTITRITCTYDYMGRRATKKVEEITTNAEGNESITVISNHRFIYRGYLQIGCCDLTRSGHPCLWLITWDPTQPIATRPLAIQKDGTWYTYGWDLTKNICEIFGQNGYIRSTYAYTPFGIVTASGDVNQSIQWSSEFYDSELDLVYYNYRHYNPTDGRWINRDPIAEQGGRNLYGFVGNIIFEIDYIGLAPSFSFNKKKCQLVMKIRLAVHRDELSNIELKKLLKIKKRIMSSIKSIWNQEGKTHPLKIYPTNKTAKECPCCDGIMPLIDFIDEKSTEYDLIIYMKRKKSNRRSNALPMKGYANKTFPNDRGYMNLVIQKERWPMIPAHEFGHNLGLTHPGQDKVSYSKEVCLGGNLITKAPYTYKGKDCYGNDVDGYKDLMGVGIELRPFYFQHWVKFISKKYSKCCYQVIKK